jgi:hypothetical protein
MVKPFEIMIDNKEPFIPDKIISAGVEYGSIEITQPEDKIRRFIPSTSYAKIHYIKDGLEYRLFYSIGKWTTSESGLPRLCVESCNHVQS